MAHTAYGHENTAHHRRRTPGEPGPRFARSATAGSATAGGATAGGGAAFGTGAVGAVGAAGAVGAGGPGSGAGGGFGGRAASAGVGFGTGTGTGPGGGFLASTGGSRAGGHRGPGDGGFEGGTGGGPGGGPGGGADVGGRGGHGGRSGGGRTGAGRGGGGDGPDRGWRAVASRYALLPLRLFLGVTFVYAGLDKLTDARFLSASGTGSLGELMRSVRDGSAVPWLVDLALRDPVLFGYAIGVGEVAVGLGTLAGLLARVAAAGGALISLSLWLTVSWQSDPYYYGNDLAYLMAWLPLVLAGAPVLSADAALAARRRRTR
ncbi:hypothetical protein SUDANB37_03589 [Streptomyces sp. enrichment culture]